MPRPLDSKRAAALYAETRSLKRTAELIGATPAGVWGALRRAGVEIQTISEGTVGAWKRNLADPDWRAARVAQLSRAGAAGAAARRDAPISIPAWVPDYLRPIYADIARSEGEESAAGYCRKAKRQSVEARV